MYDHQLSKHSERPNHDELSGKLKHVQIVNEIFNKITLTENKLRNLLCVLKLRTLFQKQNENA